MIDTSRFVDFATYHDHVTADYNSRSTQIFIDAGVPLTYGMIKFEPFAGVSYTRLHTGAFTEEGGAAALRSGSSNDDLTTSTLGIRAQTRFQLNDKIAMLRGLVGWRHNYNNITPTSTLSFLTSEPFSVSGLPYYREALALGAGLDLVLTDKVTIGVSYDGQISSNSRDHGARVNLRAKY